jgi:hypothetical protein
MDEANGDGEEWISCILCSVKTPEPLHLGADLVISFTKLLSGPEGLTNKTTSGPADQPTGGPADRRITPKCIRLGFCNSWSAPEPTVEQFRNE